jgi:hypothetical protein
LLRELRRRQCFLAVDFSREGAIAMSLHTEICYAALTERNGVF